MPGRQTINTTLDWNITCINLVFTDRDQAALFDGGGRLPAEHIPDSEVRFAYTREDGSRIPQIRVSGEHVRDVVEQGLPHELGNRIVREILEGNIVNTAPEGARPNVEYAEEARSIMAGAEIDMRDGTPVFVVTAP